MRGQTARAFADARHADRFGKTGRLDFAFGRNFGAGELFLSAHKFEDMTEPGT